MVICIAVKGVTVSTEKSIMLSELLLSEILLSEPWRELRKKTYGKNGCEGKVVI